MAYVVTTKCIGKKDRSCVEVCPVECFYDIRKKKFNTKYGVEVEGEDGDVVVGMLTIHPDECISCGACEPECPWEAIYEDSGVPEDLRDAIEINQEETVPLGSAELDAVRCTAKI
jgi:ferredoxin